MTHHRTIREQLAPGFLQELTRHDARVTTHTGPNWDPALVHALIEDAAAARASDVHLEPGRFGTTVRFRIDGVVCDAAKITTDQSTVVTNQLKALANLDPVASFVPRNAHASCALKSGPLDLRLAFTPSQTGEAAAFRLLDSGRLQRSIKDLGLGEANLQLIESWIEDSAGMFLAAGPTGCGKTTTVYSLLHEVRKGDRAIVSLEDPVEYQIDGIVQVQLDEHHHLDFGEGVKQMLRLDPDYVMLGEIRDAVSAHAAVNAAISGRVLMSTLHCRDAVGALTALRNWGLPDHEIAEALTVVVGQRLVRRLCPRCRRTRTIDAKERTWFSSLGLSAPMRVPEPAGCAKCGHLGFSGRTGIFEMWRLQEQDYQAILEHQDEHSIRRALAQRDHHSIVTDGLAKVMAGITTVSELRRAGSAPFPSQQLLSTKANNGRRVKSTRRLVPRRNGTP